MMLESNVGLKRTIPIKLGVLQMVLESNVMRKLTISASIRLSNIANLAKRIFFFVRKNVGLQELRL